MRILLLAASMILALTASALAEGCAPTTTVADVDTGATTSVTGARHYVVDDCFLGWCTFFGLFGVHVDGTLWIYEESNGIDGLQRTDEIHDDTCGGEIPGDTIIF